jgi:hypothetical protein
MHFEEPGHPARPWFAVRVNSRCEKIVSAGGARWGGEGFLPLYECRRCWSGGSKAVKFPLFPGYIFCRLGPHWRGAMQVGAGTVSTPDSVHLFPTIVSPATIIAPRCHLDLI